MLNPQNWAMLPTSFWAVVFFVFGAIVGSFLNVCIYRLPREESLWRPGSHCPHCSHAIPWRYNLPLISWLGLRGRCAFCRAGISPRYFLVEALTAVLFMVTWLHFGATEWALALVNCLLLGGLIVATFIDFEHFIIPDEITIGGIFAGFLCTFLVPDLHHVVAPPAALARAFGGAALGGGLIYALLRLGKLLFGRQRFALAPGSRVCFSETSLHLPDTEIPYEEIFYRRTDAIVLHAAQVEMVDRCYANVAIRLTQETLQIGEETFKTEEVPCLEVVTDEVVIPREAMGLGDVKFMAAIGAFVGWTGVLFALMLSALLGSVVGVALIAFRRREWSSRIPYGPYIAASVAIWIFAGDKVITWWLGG